MPWRSLIASGTRQTGHDMAATSSWERIEGPFWPVGDEADIVTTTAGCKPGSAHACPGETPMYRTILPLALLTLASCTTTPAEPPQAVCPPTDNWQVWIDIVGGDLALIADGEVTVPAGMVARLRPGALDKSMPPGQRFVLELRPGRGPSGPQRVRGVAKPAMPRYREVIIGCGDQVLDRIDGEGIETAD
jgi:hypothetical protein